MGRLAGRDLRTTPILNSFPQFPIAGMGSELVIHGLPNIFAVGVKRPIPIKFVEEFDKVSHVSGLHHR